MSTARDAAAGNGILSSLTSFFGGANLNDDGSNGASTSTAPASKRPAGPRKGSSFFSRRAAHNTGDDDAAWTLPYAVRSPGLGGQDSPRSATPMNGSGRAESSSAYGQPSPYSGLAAPGNVGTSTATDSSSTLVPGQSRLSMALNTKVAIPSTAYPPLKHTWRRIRAWSDQNYSELADTLNYPATEAQIEDLELEIGYSLPPAVRDSFLCHDGQEIESHQSCADGLFFGLPLMSLEQISEEWRFWRGVDEDPSSGANPEVKGWMNSCPAGWVRHEYSCRAWIPLVTDKVGNYVGVDLSPPTDGGGAPGQVILFGRDFDTKIVLWRGEGEGGWGRFLQSIAEELETGETWTLESELSSDSNDEEDAIGYEGYYSETGGGHGGERGGDGAASFKLRGEYKGWPVLEAWADRSMRSWEEIGMPVGQPAWRVDPPRVVLPDEVEAPEEEYEDSREYNDAYGYGYGTGSSSAQPESPDRDGTRADGSKPSHPLDNADDSAQNLSHDTLLHPPMRSYRARREQQDSLGSQQGPGQPQGQGQQRPRKAMPVPAAPLDLPTIDDVRAAHAAALASQQRGGFYYDADRARPPAGAGGMGMGMGMGTGGTAMPSYLPRQSGRKASASNHDRRAQLGVSDDDGLELEHRPSGEMSAQYRGRGYGPEDAMSGGARQRLSHDIVVDMAPSSSSSGSTQYPAQHPNGPRTPTMGARTLYSAGSATHSNSNLPLNIGSSSSSSLHLTGATSTSATSNGRVSPSNKHVASLIDDAIGSRPSSPSAQKGGERGFARNSSETALPA